MKNICFFNSTNFWGGGEKLHLENAIEFKEINYNVILLSKFNSPLWKKANEKNLKTHPIKVKNLSFLNPIKIVKLVFFYKIKSIDTVVFSTSEDLKFGSIAAYLAGIKRIVYLRGLAVPIKNNFINRFIFNHILTHIIANSNETKKNMLKHLERHVREEKINIIYHGISIENQKTNTLEEIEKNKHGIVLGNAGRLTEQKGQDKLIEIAKKLYEQNIDFTLFIAGEGNLKSQLEHLIEKHELKNHVVLLGHVEDMEGFMNSIDIFLLSSIWEGFGFVLAEAMLKSKPIVAFDISSNPELVENGKSGFLVKYSNLDDFTNKIIRLTKDKALRENMGNEGLKSVMKKFVLKDRILEIEAYLKSTP
ncbi:MAG: glycosyltransferase family 4 protein [Solirubrobacteraceae bacterium]